MGQTANTPSQVAERGAANPIAALRILGVCIAALFGFAVALKAALMLFSPRCWFRLPTWIALRGSMREARYVTGSGAIETRLTGAPRF